MKNSIKIKLISLLGLLMSVCVAFGMLTFASATNNASALSYASGEFEMLGMSIRYMGASGDDGIRFGVKLKRSIYDSLATDTNAVAGILIAPKDQVTAGGNEYLDIWTAVASHARYAILYNGNNGTNQWQVGPDYAVGIVYLDGFPSASYNRPILARGYIDWNNDGNSSTVYHTNAVTKSMSDVALAVQTDAEGAFGTTAEQKTRLDTYLLSYDVTFLNPYGHTVEVKTQSVKYGSKFNVPASPAERTGYTLSGWCAKNGASSYSTTVTDLSVANNRIVKYATSYKPKYTTTGSTFQRPNLVKKFTGNSNYNGGSDFRFIYDNEPTQIFASDGKAGVYMFEDASVAQSTNFVIYATVIGSGSSSHANNIGFAVGTLASDTNHLMFQFTTDRVYLARYMGTSTDTGSWGGTGTLTRQTYKRIALVYKDGYYYMFLNGMQMAKISQTESIANSWSGGTFTIQSYVGTSGNKQIGLSCYAGNLNCTDWGYSTDSTTINSYFTGAYAGLTANTLYSAANTFTINGTSASINFNGIGLSMFTGVEIPQNTDFVLYAKVNSGFTTMIGFVVGTFATDGTHMIAGWRANDMIFYKDKGGWKGHDDNLYKPGYGSNLSDARIALVYKGTKYYLFLNGVQKLSFTETKDLGWGFVPQTYVGTSGNKKIGLACASGVFNLSNWGYSTRAADINAYVPS